MTDDEPNERSDQDHRGETRLPGNLRRINPTEPAQYLRLNQCERYLWLRLYQHTGQSALFKTPRVDLQAIPPLLTQQGGRFEADVERAIKGTFPTVDCREQARQQAGQQVGQADTAAAQQGSGGVKPRDNGPILAAARALRPGEVRAWLQPHLEARLGDWDVSGDLDILRLWRDRAGTLQALIVDTKSATAVKIEHGIQLAFYRAVLAALLEAGGIAGADIGIGVLYRCAAGHGDRLSEDQTARRQREDARRLLGTQAGLLQVLEDPDDYVHAVETLVTGPDSAAARIAALPLEDAFFVLDRKCGGCLYNQFCLRWCHDQDDLSLVPFLSPTDKRTLLGAGVRTVAQLAALKRFVKTQSVKTPGNDGGGRPEFWRRLAPTPATEPIVRALERTTVGSRLDELIHRARRVRRDRARRRRRALIPAEKAEATQ